mgnify:CR=1 FL=1|jgi:hypothetical protein
MALLETCTDHVKGEDFFTVTAAETWSIAMVKRLKAKYPEEVEIRSINQDGSMVARLPFSWMRIVPKKSISETHRAKLSEILYRSRATVANAPNSDEWGYTNTGTPQS